MIEANQFHKLLAIFFFPLLLFIRLISPFYKIRLNLMMSERIGHFTEASCLSLCEKIQGEKYKDIYWFNTPTCNTQLEKMVKRVFFVSGCVRYLLLANNFFPSLKLVPTVNKLNKGNDRRATLEIPYSKTKGNISYFFCTP